MNRWWRIPSAVADLTLGTMIVLWQLTVQARTDQRAEARDEKTRRPGTPDPRWS
jgi:hypothetical protein